MAWVRAIFMKSTLVIKGQGDNFFPILSIRNYFKIFYL